MTCSCCKKVLVHMYADSQWTAEDWMRSDVSDMQMSHTIANLKSVLCISLMYAFKLHKYHVEYSAINLFLQ